MAKRESNWISIICTPEEKKLWEKKAKESGMNRNEWIRWLCNNLSIQVSKTIIVK
jgi:hypothetical protein